MTRLLVLMGSGETTPTMVTTHQRVLAALGDRPRAVLLDTPYGFQENADEVTAKAVGYFRASVGAGVEVASLRRPEDASPIELETARAAVADADWVFAGPGSPTYFARQLLGTPVREALAGRLRGAGATVFSSAAAVTLGAHAVPVYEIYKAGADPHWVPGLDLLAEVGIDAVCLPHFDNRDGGDAFDTRFCFLGERRLRALEAQLPEGTWILGVDEHTALVLDLRSGEARVEGRGAVTVRRGGAHTTFPAGSRLTIDDLNGQAPERSSAPPATDPAEVAPAPPTAGLDDALTASAEAFDAALSAGRLLDAAEATVALEQAIRDWSTDVEQADTSDRARAELRRQVGTLARVAQEGLHEHRELVAPSVDVLLEVRQRARSEGRFADADAIRDALVAAGVEVRDTAEGADWTYHDPLAEVLHRT
jgi:cyanophycinase-like exopeptidase